MTRLPARLQPLWPVAKRLHRTGARISGALFRRLAPLFGERGLPRSATLTSRESAALEAPAVRVHGVAPPETVVHETPGPHPAFDFGRRFEFGERFVLEIEDGTVVGEYGAVVTPGGRLDFETSPYFATSDWREHPLFLRRRLPAAENVDGTVLALATRGGQGNYYHFLFDVLPRWATYRAAFPDATPDALYVPRSTPYHRQLLDLAGLGDVPVIEATKQSAVRASRLLVPSESNPMEMAPEWMVDFVRGTLRPQRTEGLPKRLFVTRGAGPHTRRWVQEQQGWPLLADLGFTRIDPGTLTVQEQIDHFAAADVIVGLHGAALANLAFIRPGTRVLEVFTPTYVKHCYWVITTAIPDVRYRYLLADGPSAKADDAWLTGIQDDIDLSPGRLRAEVEHLLAD